MSDSIEIGVVVDRVAVTGNPWADHAWRVAAIVPGAPQTEPWTELASSPAATRFYAGSATLSLYRSDSANYRDNLQSGTPMLWVVLDRTEAAPGVEIRLVTADPAEGEGATQAGDDLVEAVPLPREISDWIADFILRHPATETFYKRARE